MKNWIVVCTFFGLWLATNFPDRVETVLAFIFISTVGILHGTNDINIIRSVSRETKGRGFFWRVLSLYIGLIIAILFLFLFFPLIALFTFIVFSGYHFGEQHLKNKMNRPRKGSGLFFTVYGSAILFLIFYAKAETVLPIISELSGFVTDVSLVRNVLLILLLMTSIGFVFYRKSLNTNPVKEFFYLLILYVVFHTASLLWGFCLYFVLWHSIPSINDQMYFLYGSIDRVALLKYLKACWPYWLVSVSGMCIVYFWFSANDWPLLNALIYLLAAITIPHILVMSRLDGQRTWE